MKRIRTINPFTAMMVMMMLVLGFSAISLGLTNLTSINTKNVLDGVNETASNTNQLAEDIARVFFSQNRTNTIIGEVRQIADNLSEFQREAERSRLEAEQSRQRLSQSLVPALQRSFNQTDRIDDVVQNLTERLAEQRFIDKQIRDTNNGIAFSLSRVASATEELANATSVVRDYLTFLRGNFNETMLEATYHEYAITDEMYENISIINDKLDRILLASSSS